MKQCDLLSQCQSEAEAGMGTVSECRALLEGLHDARQIAGGDADAGVAHGDGCGAVGTA